MEGDHFILINFEVPQTQVNRSIEDLQNLPSTNIIFSDKYYFIDFLDNEFESPLNDLAKIKQELCVQKRYENKNHNNNSLRHQTFK